MTYFLDNAGGLTADDVKALRAAKQVVFQHQKGRSEVRATVLKALLGEAVEVTKHIPAGARVATYEGSEQMIRADGYKAFSMIHAATYDRQWATIARLLRKGDRLVLSWGHGGHTSELLREKGLAGDTLDLEVYREDVVAMSFHLDSRVCEADSIVRMIQVDRTLALVAQEVA